MANKAFSSGKHSWAICDRCGFRFKYNELLFEPGTKWRVCRTCNDKGFSLVTHPQNQPPPVWPDPQALRNPRPDVTMEAPTSIWSPRDSIYFVSTS